MNDGIERVCRGCGLLALALIAGLACGEGESPGAPERDAVASPSGRGGSGTGGTGGTARMDAGLRGGGGAGARADAAVSDSAGATGTPDAGSSDADAGRWWAGAGWRSADWGPGMCQVSVLADPSVIQPLQWRPFEMGALVGETPVVPAGHYYTELPDGTNWTTGQNESGQLVVAVRDANNAALFGFMPGCSFDIVRTRRGLCVFVLAFTGEPAALACGDLLAPDPFVEFERSRYPTATGDALVIVGHESDHGQYVVDMRDGSVSSTLVPGVPGHGHTATAVHGRNVFAIYDNSGGVIFAWDGSTGYTELRDPRPLGAVNLHTDGNQLIWTESELMMPFTGASIYKAPLPASSESLTPTLVRKLKYPPTPDYSTLGAGYLAIHDLSGVQLVRIADGAHWSIPTPEPWSKKGSRPFINERTLGFHLFDGTDTKQRWVTFRAKLSDVLALPSD